MVMRGGRRRGQERDVSAAARSGPGLGTDQAVLVGLTMAWTWSRRPSLFGIRSMWAFTVASASKSRSAISALDDCSWG